MSLKIASTYILERKFYVCYIIMGNNSFYKLKLRDAYNFMVFISLYQVQSSRNVKKWNSVKVTVNQCYEK